MRSLTIAREATLAGRFSKNLVYIEDWESNELTLGNVPCRKLGVLKNGEERTFSIGDNAARIFVTSGGHGKRYRYDFCSIPEGTEDLRLSGKQIMTVGDCNFSFDGQPEEETWQVRKARLKRGLVLRILSFTLAFVICFIAYKALIDEEETFSAKEMSITLPEEFVAVSESGTAPFELYLTSRDMVVCAERLSTTEVTELALLDLHGFAASLLANNTFEDGEAAIQSRGDLLYFETPNKVAGTEYHCFVFLFKYEHTFWIVQFNLHFTVAQEYRDQVFDWAESITFESE